MALHTQLPIHKKACDLLALVARIVIQMPRPVKRYLGDMITNHCVNMLEHMVLANATRHGQRAQHIQHILTHHRAASTWLRVGFDMRAVPVTLWAQSVQMLDSVGKQANGWLNRTKGIGSFAMATNEKAPAA